MPDWRPVEETFYRGDQPPKPVTVWVTPLVYVAPPAAPHKVPMCTTAAWDPLEYPADFSQIEFDERVAWFEATHVAAVPTGAFPNYEFEDDADLSWEVWRNPSRDRLELIGAVQVQFPGHLGEPL